MKPNWFTIEALGEDTYAISEYRHREETHCYLLLGQEQALLIDTGLGVGDLKAVVSSLTSLPIQVVTTHAHWDHIGSHGQFAHIAVHPLEAPWLSGRFPLPLDVVKQNLNDPNCAFPRNFCWQDFSLYSDGAAAVYKDGDTFDLGGRRIEVLHTPGHSPGHCCFYEADRGWLYSGDLIYRGKLDAFYPTTDPGLFSRSVHRIAGLPLTRVLPGHHALDVDGSIVGRVDAALTRLEREGRLHHGAGLFDFGDFQLHF